MFQGYVGKVLEYINLCQRSHQNRRKTCAVDMGIKPGAAGVANTPGVNEEAATASEDLRCG